MLIHKIYLIAVYLIVLKSSIKPSSIVTNVYRTSERVDESGTLKCLDKFKPFNCPRIVLIHSATTTKPTDSLVAKFATRLIQSWQLFQWLNVA